MRVVSPMQLSLAPRHPYLRLLGVSLIKKSVLVAVYAYGAPFVATPTNREF